MPAQLGRGWRSARTARSPRPRAGCATSPPRGRAPRPPPSTARTSRRPGSPIGHQQQVGARRRARPCSAAAAAAASDAPVLHRLLGARTVTAPATDTDVSPDARHAADPSDRRRRPWPDRAGRGGLQEVGPALARGRAGAGRAQAAWHVWVDGAVHVVSGGLEQPLPGARRTATDGRRDAAQQGHLGPAGHLSARTVTTVRRTTRRGTAAVDRAARQTAQPTGRRGAARPVGAASRVITGIVPDRACCVEAPRAHAAPVATRRAAQLAGHDARSRCRSWSAAGRADAASLRPL